MQASILTVPILRYDRKIASYKIALSHSSKDFVLGYVINRERSITTLLPRMLASFWTVYDWLFTGHKNQVNQGRTARDNTDNSFRAAMKQYGPEW